MAWTPKILLRQLNNGRLVFQVRFTSASGVIATESIQANDVESLKAQIASLALQFQKNEDLLATIPDGDVDTTPAPVIEDPAVTEVNGWVTKYRKYRNYLELIKNGVVLDTDPDFLTLKTAVLSGYKKKFVDNI